MNIFISHIYQLIPTLSIISLDDLEELSRSEEGSELIVPVVSWIEVRLLLLEESSDIPEKCPSIIICEIRYGVSYEIDDLLIHSIEYWSEVSKWDDLLSFDSLLCLSSLSGFLRLLLQDLDIDELVTCDDEWLRSLLLSHTIDCHACFS